MSWLTIWTAVLLGALVLFLAIVVVVTIGGARDLRALFTSLREAGDGDA